MSWHCADILDAGYVGECEYRSPGDDERFLIVTEGSSDSSILRVSLPLVEPEVADFFEFVDMKDNYPFTGTGSLVNFCMGLIAIHVRNKILVVIDNDTAGRDALHRLRDLALPRSMRLMLLPELGDMKTMTTLGPSGTATENVNGRAVAIECFLDLTTLPTPPQVRWTSFNRDLDAYQGELVGKERYSDKFFEEARRGSCDLRKLAHLWKRILAECVAVNDAKFG